MGDRYGLDSYCRTDPEALRHLSWLARYAESREPLNSHHGTTLQIGLAHAAKTLQSVRIRPRLSFNVARSTSSATSPGVRKCNLRAAGGMIPLSPQPSGVLRNQRRRRSRVFRYI